MADHLPALVLTHRVDVGRLLALRLLRGLELLHLVAVPSAGLGSARGLLGIGSTAVPALPRDRGRCSTPRLTPLRHTRFSPYRRACKAAPPPGALRRCRSGLIG